VTGVQTCALPICIPALLNHDLLATDHVMGCQSSL
jgi:hypothetical protein